MLRKLSGLLILLLCTFGNSVHASIVDLTHIDPEEGEILNGKWDFYWNQFVSADHPGVVDSEINLPCYWSENYPSFGYATIQKQVILPDAEKLLGLEIEHIHSSYRVIVNQDTLYRSGVTHMDPDLHEPHRQPAVIPLQGYTAGDTITLSIQISNYSHYLAGVEGNIKLGAFKDLENDMFREEALNLFVAGSFIVITITLIVFYIMFSFHMQRMRGELISYALFCLVIGYRIVGSGSYPLHRLIHNMDYELSIRLEYMSFFLAAVAGIVYMWNLYPKQSNQLIVFSYAGISLFGAILCTFLNPVAIVLVSKGHIFLSAFVTIHAIQVIYRAIKEKEKSAKVIAMACAIMTILVVLQMVIAVDGIMPNNLLLTIGLLLFSFANNIALLERFIYGYKVYHSKQREAEISQNQKMLMSLVAHEIKTPLSQLKLNAEMLQMLSENGEMDKFKEKVPKIVGRTSASVENLNGMVTDLMHFTSQHNMSKNPYSQECIVERMQNEINAKVTDFTKHKNHVVRTNETVMEYLLHTLVNNALKFTPEGNNPPEVIISDKRGKMIISIVDHGIGMSEEDQKELGKPFIKMNLKKDGTGLGFYLTKNLIEGLGHELTVESAIGEGTTVTLTLDAYNSNALNRMRLRKPTVKDKEPKSINGKLSEELNVA